MSTTEFLGNLPLMETRDILSHINAEKFFKKYLPHIKRYKHKMRGKDSAGKPLDFSPEERKEIIKALDVMFKDLKKK